MFDFRPIPVSAVLVAAILTLAPAPVPAQAAAAQTEVFLELRPNTIQAGFQIGVVADCGDDLNPATVRSAVFGEITLAPEPTTGLLTGTVVVPATTAAGEYRVELRCVDGDTASAELFVFDMARPTRGPDTGGGGAARGTAAAAPALLAAGGAAAICAGLLLTRRRVRS